MEVRPQSAHRLDIDIEECKSLGNIYDDLDESNIATEEKDLADSNIPTEDKAKRDKAPEVGMEFESEDQAYNFYNTYARGLGFRVRRNWVHRTNYGVVHDRTFTCACEGQRVKDKRRLNVKNPRPQTRTGCRARMIITLQANDKYRVSHFEAIHNHEFVTTPQDQILKSQRLTIVQTAQASMTDSSRIRPIQPKTTVDFMGRQAEGRNSLASIIQVNAKEALRKRYNELCHIFVQIAAKAAETEEGYTIAINYASRALREVEQIVKRSRSKEPQNISSQVTGSSLSETVRDKCTNAANEISTNIHVESLSHHNNIRVELADSVPFTIMRGNKRRERGKGGGRRIQSSTERGTRKKRPRNETSLAPKTITSVATHPLGIEVIPFYPYNQLTQGLYGSGANSFNIPTVSEAHVDHQLVRYMHPPPIPIACWRPYRSLNRPPNTTQLLLESSASSLYREFVSNNSQLSQKSSVMGMHQLSFVGKTSQQEHQDVRKNGESGSRGVLDAFFLGKTQGEALNERAESTVGEFLSAVGRPQADQQKQVQGLQEEVLERAKEKVASEAMEAQELIPKSTTVVTSAATDVTTAISSSAATDVVTPAIPPSLFNPTTTATNRNPTNEEEEVLERAKIVEEKVAKKAMETQELIPKSATLVTMAATDVLTPAISPLSCNPTNTTTNRNPTNKEEVLEMAKRTKENVAQEAIKAPELLSKSTTIVVSAASDVVNMANSHSGTTDAATPPISPLSNPTTQLTAILLTRKRCRGGDVGKEQKGEGKGGT